MLKINFEEIKRHKVGGIYTSAGDVYMVVEQDREHFAFLNLATGKLATGWYNNLDELDEDNKEDRELEGELIVR